MIATLGSGGAERVMSLLASGWAERGDRVTLVTLDDAEPFYPLHPAVRVHPLRLTGAASDPLDRVRRVLERVRSLRSVLRSLAADVCVSFIDRMNVLVLAATRGLDLPVVVSERVHPGFVDPWGWGAARRTAYLAADLVVAQTERTAAWLRRPIGPSVMTIPNPVTDPGEAKQHDVAHRVVAAGRLVPQKGFDVLLRAFACATRDRQEWQLDIWGDGPERAALVRLAADLGVAGRVRLGGRTADIFAELRRADIFVLSSRFEGFPNALCEAMAVGLAVVASRCPSGPDEIVRHDHDGLLVPPEDVSSLSAALMRLMDRPDDRVRLGKNARAIRDRLGLESVLARWEDAFTAVGV